MSDGTCARFTAANCSKAANNHHKDGRYDNSKTTYKTHRTGAQQALRLRREQLEVQAVALFGDPLTPFMDTQQLKQLYA